MTAPQVFVDYSLVGHGRRFRTRVEAALRGQLHAGDTVVVLGDDVAPARARVLVVDDPELTDEPGPGPGSHRQEVDAPIAEADQAGVVTALRGAHAGPGPTSEQARATDRARTEETVAPAVRAGRVRRRVRGRTRRGHRRGDGQAAQRLSARGRGKQPGR